MLLDNHRPVHAWFELTYAAYLVWPRMLMDAMPIEWQERFVELANEYAATWDYDDEYTVQHRDKSGRFEHDPLRHYRHPSPALLDTLRRERECQN